MLDIGGRSVNGTPRHLFSSATYVVLDAIDGPDVDIVADAAYWEPDREYDVVLSTETFEHTPLWRDVLGTMVAALKPGGHLLVTCATDPREPHSGIDGWALRDGEWYGNVDPDDLFIAIADHGLDVTTERHARGDVYAEGQKS